MDVILCTSLNRHPWSKQLLPCLPQLGTIACMKISCNTFETFVVTFSRSCHSFGELNCRHSQIQSVLGQVHNPCNSCSMFRGDFSTHFRTISGTQWRGKELIYATTTTSPRAPFPVPREVLVVAQSRVNIRLVDAWFLRSLSKTKCDPPQVVGLSALSVVFVMRLFASGLVQHDSFVHVPDTVSFLILQGGIPPTRVPGFTLHLTLWSLSPHRLHEWACFGA